MTLARYAKKKTPPKTKLTERHGKKALKTEKNRGGGNGNDENTIRTQ